MRRSAPLLVLHERRLRPAIRNARDVAARILSARFGDAPAQAGSDGLLDFQRDAVARARSILARRTGVVIADGVGLGKTHVASALVREALTAGLRVTIVGPAALQRHWRDTVADPRAEWLSYARLSRVGLAREPSDFVVFDEAHALRNPATQRHQAARRMCRGSRVVLLTATPVNNSVWDLYYLLRLFSADRDFADVGVPSLRGAFEAAASTCLLGAAPTLDPVLRAAVIRRTRSSIGAALAEDGRLAFPLQHAPRPVHYAFDCAGSIDYIGVALLELTFPAHGTAASVAPGELMRIGLLKRLESSVHAFQRSIARYALLLERCLAALDRGLLVRARDDPDAGDDDAQLRFDELLFQPLRCAREAERYRVALEAELSVVRRLKAGVSESHDAKLDALVALLLDELHETKVIVFTQYRDTARWIHARLRSRFRVALIDGAHALLGSVPCTRADVVRRFAPHANAAPAPAECEAIDVLVASDVLSEGFNLQDASAVVSYDLPWNPIRLMQRVGRVDRLGSPHAAVASYHFVPGELERYLGLVERVARKTIAIETTVGSDMPHLHASLVRSLDRGEHDLIRRIEHDDAGTLEIDERLRRLLVALPQRARDRDDDTMPVGVVAAGRANRGREAPSGLVAAFVGARFEWTAVVDGCVADDRAAAALLERASTQAPVAFRPPTSQVEALLRIARRAIAKRAAAASGAALLPAGGRAALLGRRLLSAAAALPGGPDASLCARIERALDHLARARDGVDVRVESAAGLSGLLDAIERIPADVGATSPRGLAGGCDGAGQRGVRIVGVLVETTTDR